MKYQKITIIGILLLLIGICTIASADWWKLHRPDGREIDIGFITQPATSSGTAVTGRCLFLGLAVTTDGTNDVTINLYDNTASSGNKLGPTDVVAKGSDENFGYKPPKPLPCDTGVYVNINVAGGGSCSWVIFYDQ